MTEFGSGPYLTQDFDWEVTNTGDIRATFGTRELEKDIALFSVAALQQVVGRQQDANTRGRIKSIVIDVLNNDPRVDSVANVNVRFLSRRNEAEVTCDVITDNNEQELVFTLGEQ